MRIVELVIGTDEGIFIHRGGRLEHPPPHDVSVRGIAARGDHLLAVTRKRAALLESPDRGRSFVAREAVGGHDGWALEEEDGRFWVGTGPAKLFTSGNGVVWEELASLARAEGHERWSFFPPQPPHVLAIAARGDLILAGIEMGGIYRSTDRGATWRRVQAQIDDDVHRIRLDGERAFCAAQDGVHLSDDLGLTWRTVLPDRYAHGLKVTSSGIVVQVAGGDGVICFSRDGEAWEERGTDLPQPDFGVDGLDVAEDGTLAYGGDGSIFIGTDRGRRWERLLTGLPKIRRVLWLREHSRS